MDISNDWVNKYVRETVDLLSSRSNDLLVSQITKSRTRDKEMSNEDRTTINTNGDWIENALSAYLEEENRKNTRFDAEWRLMLAGLGIRLRNTGGLITTKEIMVDGVLLKRRTGTSVYTLIYFEVYPYCPTCGDYRNNETQLAAFTLDNTHRNSWQDDFKDAGRAKEIFGALLASSEKKCYTCKTPLIYRRDDLETPTYVDETNQPLSETGSGEPTTWLGGMSMGEPTINMSTLVAPTTNAAGVPTGKLGWVKALVRGN